MPPAAQKTSLQEESTPTPITTDLASSERGHFDSSPTPPQQPIPPPNGTTSIPNKPPKFRAWYSRSTIARCFEVALLIATFALAIVAYLESRKATKQAVIANDLAVISNTIATESASDTEKANDLSAYNICLAYYKAFQNCAEIIDDSSSTQYESSESSARTLSSLRYIYIFGIATLVSFFARCI
ncbi:MAG: hypothetical protein Q9225_005046 [Loekoesia sp. 1 TL-2023]